MVYLYYNPFADNNNGEKDVLPAQKKLEESLKEKIELASTDCDWNEEIRKFKREDKVILCGGDGTLNHFINAFDPSLFPAELYLLPMGTGNDFLNDQKAEVNQDGLVPLSDKLQHLPVITVKDKTYRFINGIGYGIDGDCCVKAEQMKKEGAKDISYSSITINLLLKSYVPNHAKVRVDGKEYEFDKVYLASSMYGKYYGGGMMIAPSQDRKERSLSFVTIHGMGKLRTLMLFPKIFKGEHVKDRKHVAVLTGKEIEVTFSKPCGLQIDGEVVEDVLSYRVRID